jgi:hypothetical protein
MGAARTGGPSGLVATIAAVLVVGVASVGCSDDAVVAPGPVDTTTPPSEPPPTTPPPIVTDPAALAGLPAYLRTPASSTFMSGVELGSPFDSITHAPKPMGVSAGKAIAPGFVVADAPGQLQARATIRRIQTANELYSAMEVSASISVGKGVFGASASVDFARSIKINSEYLYLLVEASARGRIQRVSNAALTEEAKKLSPEVFYSLYGDRFASALVMGQQIFGIIEIRTKSIEQKESLAVSLGVSYGASSLSSSVKQTLEQKSSEVETHVIAGALGTTPPVSDDLDVFLQAVDAKFTAFATAQSDPGTQTLAFEYTPYAGMAGYPGLPVGIEAKVAEHQRAVTEAVLYGSLVSDYTLAGYDMTSPLFAGMKTHAASLSDYLTKSVELSPNLPPLPVVPATSAFTTFAKVVVAEYPAHAFNVHEYANGFVPKRLRDYEIPYRYLRDGAYDGVTFDPLTVNHAIPAYLTDQVPTLETWRTAHADGTGPHPCLSYRWDDGTSFFVVDQRDGTGVRDPALVGLAIQAQPADDGAAGESNKRFVMINAASGLALSRQGGTFLQAPLRPTADTSFKQWWRIGTFGYGRRVFADDRSMSMDVWNFSNALGAGIGGANHADQWNQGFSLQHGVNGWVSLKTNVSGQFYLVSIDPNCPASSGACANAWLRTGATTVQLPRMASAQPSLNQRWHFIPSERVEELR